MVIRAIIDFKSAHELSSVGSRQKGTESNLEGLPLTDDDDKAKNKRVVLNLFLEADHFLSPDFIRAGAAFYQTDKQRF